MVAKVIISGNQVKISGAYGLGVEDFWGYPAWPKSYKRVLYFKGSEAWLILRSIAIKLDGKIEFTNNWLVMYYLLTLYSPLLVSRPRGRLLKGALRCCLRCSCLLIGGCYIFWSVGICCKIPLHLITQGLKLQHKGYAMKTPLWQTCVGTPPWACPPTGWSEWTWLHLITQGLMLQYKGYSMKIPLWQRIFSANIY